MFQYLSYLVFLGAAVHLVGAVIYIRDTLSGKTKPNRVSFLLWGLAPMIGVAAAISDGVRWAILPVFLAGLGPLVVFFISFINPNAYWKLNKSDYLCALFSVLALILWVVTREPLLAIIFSIISDAFATIPTLIKSWKYPETETAIAYVASLFSALTGFTAIKMGAPAEYIFGIYLVIADTLLVLALYRNKLFLQQS